MSGVVLTAAERKAAETLGEQVRKYREAAGWSQKELGVIAGLSPFAIYNIEKGKFATSITYLMRIADGLSISLVDLLDDQGVRANDRLAEARVEIRDLRRKLAMIENLASSATETT
jgi:transcriptional regulator with XRE-family HTH domain